MSKLRATNEAYGVRDTADVEAEAAAHRLAAERRVAPANNLSLVFRR